uniref:Sulfatase N-terminal domain-containing protein n=1 Tax=Strigamia maritima TaxID=126957 RepID=T1IPA2_STRMM
MQLALQLAVVAFCGALHLSDGKKPHLIFIMGDDMGYNDVGWHNKLFHTPHMDKLAKSGVILEQYYSLPLCTPSRVALMSGIYPSLLGLQRGVLLNQEPYGIPFKYEMIPKRLKEAGYHTHQIGKWHLGYCDRRYTPLSRGFDTHLGSSMAVKKTSIIASVVTIYIQSVKNCTGVDLHDNGEVGFKHAGRYSTELWTERAEEIIHKHDSESPMYIYLAYSGTHFPLQAPEKYFKHCEKEVNQGRKNFCAATAAMDIGIGKVVEALKKKGFYDNSVIFFASDNGASVTFGGNSYPLRGAKNTMWEGGMRVPSFVHSPLLKKTGYVNERLIHEVDWYPTLLHLAGLKPQPGLSGVNQWGTISKDEESKRDEFLYLMDVLGDTVIGAVRKGDWKLITGPGGSPGTVVTEAETVDNTADEKYILHHTLGKDPYDLKDHKSKLFNLKNDPYEQNDLADKEPEKLKELWKLADHYIKISHEAIKLKEDPAGDPENFEDVYTDGWCEAYYDVPDLGPSSSKIHTYP